MLGNAFNVNEGIVVDTHVQRLSADWLTREADAVGIEQPYSTFPRDSWTLIAICSLARTRHLLARKPLCSRCVLIDVCPSPADGEVYFARLCGLLQGSVSSETEDYRDQLATFETKREHLVAELYPAEAPKTVENFEKLANSKFYDGVNSIASLPTLWFRAATRFRATAEGDVASARRARLQIPCETAGNPHNMRSVHCPWRTRQEHRRSQFFMVLTKPTRAT